MFLQMNIGNNKPYTDYVVSKSEKIRIFYESIDSEELIWHQDEHDRTIFSFVDSDWKFQFDNELPFLINKRQIITIPKMTYHRLIKGTNNLILKIRDDI